MPFKWLKRRRNTVATGERPDLETPPPVPPHSYQPRSVSANAAPTVNGNGAAHRPARSPIPTTSTVPTTSTAPSEPKIRRRKSFFGSLRKSKDKSKDDRARASSFSVPQDSAPLFNDAPPVPPLPTKLPTRLEPASAAQPSAGSRTGPKKRMSMIPRKPPPSAWNNGDESDDDVAVPAAAPPPVPAKRQTLPAHPTRSVSSPTPAPPLPQTRAPAAIPNGHALGDFVAIDAMDRLDAMGDGNSIGLGKPPTSRMPAASKSAMRSSSAPGGPTPTPPPSGKRLSSPPPTSFANSSSRAAAKPSGTGIPPMKKLPDLALDKALPDPRGSPRGSPDMVARKRMSVEPGLDPRRMSEVDRVPPTCPKYALGELPPPPADAPPTPQKEKRASVIMAEAAATKRSSLLPRAEPAAAVVPRRSPPRSPPPGPAAVASPSLDATVVAPPDPFDTFGAATRPHVPGMGIRSAIPNGPHGNAGAPSSAPTSTLSSSRHNSLPRQAPPSVPVVPTPSELTRPSAGQTGSGGGGGGSGALPRQAPPPGVEVVARPAALSGGGRVGYVGATPTAGTTQSGTESEPKADDEENKEEDDDKKEEQTKEEGASGSGGDGDNGGKQTQPAQGASAENVRPVAAEVTAPVPEIGGPNKFVAQAQDDEALRMPMSESSATFGEKDAPGTRGASGSNTTSPSKLNPRPAMSYVPPRMLARGGVAKVQGVYESRFGHPLPGVRGEGETEGAQSGDIEAKSAVTEAKSGDAEAKNENEGEGKSEDKASSDEKRDSASSKEQQDEPSATTSPAKENDLTDAGAVLPRTETFGRLPGAGTFGAHRPLSVVGTPTAPRVAEQPLDEEDEDVEDLDDGGVGRVAIDETAQVDAHARVEAPHDAPTPPPLITAVSSGTSSERSCDSGSRSAVSPQDAQPPRLPSPLASPSALPRSRSVTPDMPDTPWTPEPKTPDTPAAPELVTPATPALSEMSTTAAPPSPYTSSPLQATRSVSASTPNRSSSTRGANGPPRPDSPDKPIDPDVRRMPSAAHLRPNTRRSVSSPSKPASPGPGEPTLDEFMSLFRRVQARGQGVTIRAAAAAAEKKYRGQGEVDARVGQAL